MRQSGRTFRLILGALRAASKGERILVACSKQETVHHFTNRMVSILAAGLGLDAVYVDKRKGFVQFNSSLGVVQVACRGTTDASIYKFEEKHTFGMEYKIVFEEDQC